MIPGMPDFNKITEAAEEVKLLASEARYYLPKAMELLQNINAELQKISNTATLHDQVVTEKYEFFYDPKTGTPKG